MKTILSAAAAVALFVTLTATAAAQPSVGGPNDPLPEGGEHTIIDISDLPNVTTYHRTETTLTVTEERFAPPKIPLGKRVAIYIPDPSCPNGWILESVTIYIFFGEDEEHFESHEQFDATGAVVAVSDEYGDWLKTKKGWTLNGNPAPKNNPAPPLRSKGIATTMHNDAGCH